METTETVLSSIDPGPVMAGEAQAAEVALATLYDLPLAIGAESVRFLGRRYQAEVAHMGRLLACRSMPELAVEQMRRPGRRIDEDVLAHISPAHSANINFFGAIEVDIEGELAQLGPTGYQGLGNIDDKSHS